MIVRFDTEEEAMQKLNLLTVMASEDVKKGELRQKDIIRCEQRLIVFRQKFHTVYQMKPSFNSQDFPTIDTIIHPHGAIEDFQTIWKMTRAFEEV